LFEEKLASISTRLAIFGGARAVAISALPSCQAGHRALTLQFPSCSTATPAPLARPVISHRLSGLGARRARLGKPVSEMNLVSAPLSMQTRDKRPLAGRRQLREHSASALRHEC